MDTNHCPNCGCIRSSSCICDRCGFDFSTDAENHETIMSISGWRGFSSFRKIQWTNSRIFWETVGFPRSEIRSVLFQGNLNGIPEDAPQLLDNKRNPFFVWVQDGNMIVASEVEIAFPPDSSYLFAHLSNVTSISFDNCVDTSAVVSMCEMFNDCRRLKTLDLSSFHTASATNMAGMFSGCGRLENISLSGVDISNVRDMHDMFYGCGTLNDILLSGFHPAKASDTNDMFFGCNKLPEGIVRRYRSDSRNEMRPVSITYGVGCFWGMDGIECDAIRTVTFKNSLDKAPPEAHDISEDGDRSVLVWTKNDGHDLFIGADGTVVLPSDVSYLFYGMENLVYVRFNNHVDSSKVEDMSSMFSGCHLLRKLDFSGLDTSNVLDMSSMFSGCCSLTEIDISCCDTSSVTDMSYMFYQCSSLSEINLSNMDVKNVIDMSCMFASCANLHNLDISNFSVDKSANISDLFEECRKLENIVCSDRRILTQYRKKYHFSILTRGTQL